MDHVFLTVANTRWDIIGISCVRNLPCGMWSHVIWWSCITICRLAAWCWRQGAPLLQKYIYGSLCGHHCSKLLWRNKYFCFSVSAPALTCVLCPFWSFGLPEYSEMSNASLTLAVGGSVLCGCACNDTSEMNRLCVRYRDHPVCAVCGVHCCLLWELCQTYEYTLWAKCGFLMVKHVVHVVATGLSA
jgi:hypothetical protein